jgi:arabinofuranan 3-O-arabinosyltransferase
MRERRREVAIPLLLGVGAFALAFAQRPGLATADTKINLHVDPGRFLADVASMWTSTGQLGDVQAGQQTGYLFPMGPFFALGQAIGLSDWVVQRLWLGSLLALAAWGVMRLLDALRPGSRGVAQLAAGAVIVLNPFVVTYVNRTTVTLLAYAALPWLLLAVHCGLRDPRGWRWPAGVALLVAASGGGINGAVTAWMLLGPVLLLLYELWFTPIGWSAARAFLIRAAPLTLLASIWWIVPAYVQSSYGIDFLHFTEQPGTIWGTTSSTESLRLMSFWLSYVGLGFAGRTIPYFDDSRTLLFSAPVVVATLLLPAASLTGFVWTRRWRYGPFFLGLALVAVLVTMAGFPDGTPLRNGLTFTYNHLASVRFLRASYKAAPLLAVALACLAGVGAAELWSRLGPSLRATAATAGAAVLVLAAWPLVSGRAQDAQVSFRQIPASWRQVAADLDTGLPQSSRAIVLPGDLFSFYKWGGTVDPILPALSRRPVAERTEVPYADLRATDLLWTIDGLVHQQRLLPGQLPPLLSLIGVRSVVTATDDDPDRSDAPPAADIAAELARQPGFASPARSYGALRTFAPTGLGPEVSLPEVRRYDLPAARGLVRVEPRTASVMLDGSADGVAGLAAFGGLTGGRALLYSGDLTADGLRAAVADAGEVVISDSNRRRAFVAGSLEQNTGPTLTADRSVSADGIMLDPFGNGTAGQTVAVYTGIRSVQAPSSPERPQFPEHAPFAALDSSTRTAWLADPTLGPDRRWLEVDLNRPIDVPYVDLLPYGDAGGVVKSVRIGGQTFAVRPGWNRLRLGLHGVSSLRVTLGAISPPAPGVPAGAGGISELRIPGVHAGGYLRLPTDAATALRGRDLSAVRLAYLLQRTTGDDPFQRGLAHGPYSASYVPDAGDAEQTIRRVFELPVNRSFSATAWVGVLPQTPDSTLDRLAGYRGPVRAESSGRFGGQPLWRASRALDGDPRTAWIGDYDPAHPAWIQWRAHRPAVIRALSLLPPAEPVRRPTEVRISWPGAVTGALPVGAGGRVLLPAPVRTDAMRIDVLRAAPPPGASAADLRAVGIAELRGIAGLPQMKQPRGATFAAPCGTVAVRVGGIEMPLSVSGPSSTFEQGTPLLARSCRSVSLAAGTIALASAPGPFAVDQLELSSPAPRPRAITAGSPGQVLNGGTTGRASVDGVRVSVTGPAWLVLGEGYNRGWQAWCGNRSLGAPTPIDGYANGWQIAPGCRHVRFAFGPARLAEIGYLISAVAGLACLLLVLSAALPRWRRRRGPDDRGEVTFAATQPVGPWRRERAIAVALLLGAACGFVFGVVAGICAVPAIAIVLWRGIGARALTLVAGLLLGVVVPVLYLVHPGDETGGNHFGYATSHLAAHWVGVAAIGLLMGALWRALSGQRTGSRRRTAPAASPQVRSPGA